MEQVKQKRVIACFLKMRLLQLGRILNEIGFLRIVVLLVFCLHIIVLVPAFVTSAPWLAIFTLSLLITSLHINRKDQTFLRTFFAPYAKAICIVEYELLTLPATVLLLYSGNLIAAGVFVLVLSTIPYIKLSFRKIQRGMRVVDFLPVTAFELRSGIRNSYISILLLILAGTFLGKLIYVPIAAIFLLSVLCASYNIYCESRMMVEAYRRPPAQFLQRKLLRQAGIVFLLCLPVNISFLLFHSQYWYILLAVNTIAQLIQALSIFFKYAFYIPGETLKGNNVLLGLSVFCFLIVFLAPVPFVLLVIYYVKAKNNLNRLLYVGS